MEARDAAARAGGAGAGAAAGSRRHDSAGSLPAQSLRSQPPVVWGRGPASGTRHAIRLTGRHTIDRRGRVWPRAGRALCGRLVVTDRPARPYGELVFGWGSCTRCYRAWCRLAEGAA